MSAQRTVKRSNQRHKPRLGQNFLADASSARRIVDALGDVSKKTIIEIGPGKGVLTRLLAESARRLVAIELDRKLTAELRMNYAAQPNVEIIEADVLAVNFEGLVHERCDVIGNLPYYITSDILLKLFRFHHRFEWIVIMVQKEVAERIAARPGSRDFGLLTVTTQLFCDVELLFTLPPGAFSPPPKVSSSVLRLQVAPKARALGIDQERFLGFLKTAFAQKRKTLFNNLKMQYPGAAAAISDTGLRADVRAESTSLDQLADVFRQLVS